jgi:hypothetical protein
MYALQEALLGLTLICTADEECYESAFPSSVPFMASSKASFVRLLLEDTKLLLASTVSAHAQSPPVSLPLLSRIQSLLIVDGASNLPALALAYTAYGTMQHGL